LRNFLLSCDKTAHKKIDVFGATIEKSETQLSALVEELKRQRAGGGEMVEKCFIFCSPNAHEQSAE
jgi:hypothetical protein